ncbi:MAG: beta-lactamase family protein [Planctomycetes bacterium]|nr:beta-lactamase family protein [Planctomycetota bacterium]
MSRKHQIPNPKSQTHRASGEINPKFKAQMTETPAAAGRPVLNFGFGTLRFVWDLGFGIWDFAVVLTLALFLCLSLSCQVEPARDTRWSQLDAVVQEEIAAGHLPGAVVLVGQADRVLYHKAFGRAVAEPFEAPMRKDTVFDLASLTKPIATATAILILVDRGKIDPNDRVGDYLPAFACNGKEDVRIRHLLTHTSGLPAYTNAKELQDLHGSPCPENVVAKICDLKAQAEPGQTFRYSCLGYITLARIVQVVTGQDVDEFTRDNLFVPLGMRRTRYCPPAAWQKKTAATEIVEDHLLRGTVHDPLARLMAGTSGNAGLFSTAADLSVYCRMLLAGGVWKGKRILSADAVQMLTTAQSHGRAYGFDLSSGYAWVKGPHASPAAFCHTGYTGTSLVCDPATGTYLILLTNSVHPRDQGLSKPLRQKTAAIVFGPPASGARP